MTRRTMAATLASSSSSSRVSDVRVATSSRKSSRSLRSRNRTAGLTRDTAMSALFHVRRVPHCFGPLRRGFLHDPHAGAGADSGGSGSYHGLQIFERPDAARRFNAHGFSHCTAHQRDIGNGCAGLIETRRSLHEIRACILRQPAGENLLRIVQKRGFNDYLDEGAVAVAGRYYPMNIGLDDVPFATAQSADVDHHIDLFRAV